MTGSVVLWTGLFVASLFGCFVLGLRGLYLEKRLHANIDAGDTEGDLEVGNYVTEKSAHL